MEQPTAQGQGPAKVTQLRHLRQPEPPIPANRNPIPGCDVPTSPLGAKVFVSRRRTEQTTQKSPLKVLHSYITKAIKRKNQTGANQPQQEIPETPDPNALLPANSPNQSCARVELLDEQEAPPANLRPIPSPTHTYSRLASDDSVNPVLSDEGNYKNGTNGENGHPASASSTANWCGEPQRCSVIFLPTARRSFHGLQQFQDSMSLFRKDHWKPVKDEDKDCEASEDMNSPGAMTSSAASVEGPVMHQDEERPSLSEQGRRADRWREWMGCQSLMSSAIVGPLHAGIEKFSLLRMAFLEGARQPSCEEVPSPATVISLGETHPQVQGCCEDGKLAQTDETLPLMVMTPRVSEVATLPLSEVARLEQPSTHGSETHGFLRGLSASLTIITNLLEKVITILEGSTVVLSACNPTGPLDECHIVLDATCMDATTEGDAALKEAEEMSSDATGSMTDPKPEMQVEADERGNAKDGAERVEPPTERTVGDCHILDAQAETAEGHTECEDTSEATWDNVKGFSIAVTPVPESQHLSQSGTPAPLTRVSSVSACSLIDSPRENPYEPAFPIAAAIPRGVTLMDSSEDSRDARSCDEGGTSMAFLHVAQCTTMPTAEEEGNTTLWVRPPSCCSPEKQLLPTCCPEEPEQARSITPGLVTTRGCQVLHGGSEEAGSLLPSELGADQTSEMDDKDAEVPPTGGSSAVDRFLILLENGNGAIPTVNLPSEGTERPCSPYCSSSLPLHHDAAGLHLGSTESCGPMPMLRLPACTHMGRRKEQEDGTLLQNSAAQWTPLSPLPPICEGDGEERETVRIGCVTGTLGDRETPQRDFGDAGESWPPMTGRQMFSALMMPQGYQECRVLRNGVPVDSRDKSIVCVRSEETTLDLSVSASTAQTEGC